VTVNDQRVVGKFDWKW